MRLISFVAARRLAQYRLRTLFILIAAIAVPLSFWASREHKWRVRRAAVEVIFTHGGGVRVENANYSRYSRFRTLNRRLSRSHALLREDTVLGATCCASEAEVSAILMLPTLKSLTLCDPDDPHVYPRPIGSIDAPLRRLAGLRGLEELSLGRTRLTDRGVANLRDLRSLRVLNLSWTPITDAALTHLSAMTQLEELDLSRTLTTDDGIRCLAPLSSLRVLNLSRTNVTGHGFDNLGSLSRLERLDLSYSPVTDEGARQLAGLVSLRRLDLRDTKISGAALAHLSKLHSLEHLDLSGGEIGDEALPRLHDLPKLTWLNLSDTRVTDGGLETLSRFTALRHLMLDLCCISDRGVLSLSSARSLKILDVGRTRVTYEGADELERRNPRISVCGLAWEEMDEDDLTSGESQ